MQGVEVYQEHSKSGTLDDVIRVHSILVVKIAKNIKRRLPSYIEMNDLMQSGFIGLIEASKSFNPEMGASFETYASIKIKGMILDELRKNSWNDREAIKYVKMLGAAVNRVEQRTQDKATGDAIAKEMNITVDEYDKICQRINLFNVIDVEKLDEMNMSLKSKDEPENEVMKYDLQSHIKSILLSLPERERILLSLYYNDELTFKEISEVMQLTEARICQIHASVIAKMKIRLNK